MTDDIEQKDARRGWLATGSLLGAVLASSCCIVPFILISLGVSGAWIGQLSALEPYKPYFVGVTLLFLALGFWQVYFGKPKPCEDGTYCARPASTRVIQIALWIATVLIFLAASIDYWASLFY